MEVERRRRDSRSQMPDTCSLSTSQFKKVGLDSNP